MMPFTKDGITYVEQQSKYFMIVALVGLPLELDYVRNQILSRSNVPNYETSSEQLLRLAIPHAIGLVSTLSPNESFALASHYHVRGGQTGGRGGHRHSIRCNYYNLTVTLKLIVVQRQEKNNENHGSLSLFNLISLKTSLFSPLITMIPFNSKHPINHHHLLLLLSRVVM